MQQCNKTIQKCLTLIMLQKKTSKKSDISSNSYRRLIIGGSEYQKTNAILNLINNGPDID